MGCVASNVVLGLTQKAQRIVVVTRGGVKVCNGVHSTKPRSRDLGQNR